MSDKKDYLGDGVYVDVYVDGESIHLTTENGIRTTNSIVLEPEVYAALLRWVERVRHAPPSPVEDHQGEGAVVFEMTPDEVRELLEQNSDGVGVAQPIGRCPKCQTLVYSVEGFCGVCNPEKR
jgi:hypothetical protein